MNNHPFNDTHANQKAFYQLNRYAPTNCRQFRNVPLPIHDTKKVPNTIEQEMNELIQYVYFLSIVSGTDFSIPSRGIFISSFDLRIAGTYKTCQDEKST